MIDGDIAAALKNADHVFTRTEIACLMSTAWRWGYECRVDEENQAYPPPKIMAFGQWYDQAVYRQQCDEHARQPWPTDNQVGHRG